MRRRRERAAPSRRWELRFGRQLDVQAASSTKCDFSLKGRAQAGYSGTISFCIPCCPLGEPEGTRGTDLGRLSQSSGLNHALLRTYYVLSGFPDSSVGKESTCNAGDLGSILGLGRSPREGKGYPLQYSGLDSSMDCIATGLQSQTQLNSFHFQRPCICSYRAVILRLYRTSSHWRAC